jgi:aspartyl aminopeptidase
MDIKELKGKLFQQKRNAYQLMSSEEVSKCNEFCEGYKDFLNQAKTERESVKFAVATAEKFGYVPFTKGKSLKAGDKVYYNNRGKAIIFAVIGKEDISQGVRLCASHIDSPRLDLKQNPLYEDSELSMFKTHYYGGIKKYQWTTIPLALHGVIVKRDGSKVEVNIGEDENDPVFCVTDLLIHLSSDQMQRNLMKAIEGEKLNIIVGSQPLKADEGTDLVKLNIMRLLNEKYGIVEDDFMSAEIEAVPAFKAKDVGFDRSMIGSYGHDDRVCAYPSMMACMDTTTPNKTSVVVLTDKEETGSDGNTGLCSSYLEYFIYDLAECFGVDGRTVLSNSECLSADVNAGFDPTYPEVADKRNFAYLNYGVVVTKFTGSRGKSGTSDASAEYVGKVHNLLRDNGVIFQTGELGKVDAGGGGTVAMYIANLDVDTIDVGVPVLSMHAPFEIVAKTDVYMAYKAFYTFMNA